MEAGENAERSQSRQPINSVSVLVAKPNVIQSGCIKQVFDGGTLAAINVRIKGSLLVTVAVLVAYMVQV
jgi:hypothetical protein